MNDIQQLMRHANPVPDSHASLSDDEFSALLAFTKSRSGNMNVKELTRQVEPEEKKHRGWLIAAAAAVVVLVLGAAVMLVLPADDQAPIAPTPTTVPPVVEQETAPSTTTSLAATPTTGATPTTEAAPTVPDTQAAAIAAFIAAWNDGDVEALSALMAPDAVLEDSEFGLLDTPDKILDWAMGRHAMAVVASIDDCRPANDGRARCAAEFDGVVPIALQQVPWRDTYTFTFEDGLISRIDTVCVICVDTVPEFRLRDWVESIDDTVWESSFYGANLVSTPEKAAYFLEWAPKWQAAGRP